MKSKPVPVYSQSGKIVGHVSANATSIAASKLTGAPCSFSKRYGPWGWVAAR